MAELCNDVAVFIRAGYVATYLGEEFYDTQPLEEVLRAVLRGGNNEDIFHRLREMWNTAATCAGYERPENTDMFSYYFWDQPPKLDQLIDMWEDMPMAERKSKVIDMLSVYSADMD